MLLLEFRRRPDAWQFRWQDGVRMEGMALDTNIVNGLQYRKRYLDMSAMHVSSEQASIPVAL
jgi:hypothetical protein